MPTARSNAQLLLLTAAFESDLAAAKAEIAAAPADDAPPAEACAAEAAPLRVER